MVVSLLVLDSGFWILDLGHYFGFWIWILTLHSGKAHTVVFLGHEDSGTASGNGQDGELAWQFNFTLI